MRRIRLSDAARLVAPAAVYTGLSAYTMTDNWRWLGAGLTIGVITTLIEANKLCDRLAQLDDTAAVAAATGVLRGTSPSLNPTTGRRPGRPNTCGPVPPWPAPAHQASPPPSDEVDLEATFAELEPCFAELDTYLHALQSPNRGPTWDVVHGLVCLCGPRGGVASARRDCPIHGDGPR